MVRNAMSATEFYILQYLWTRETPATFSEIMVHFNEEEKKAWKKQTVNTFLSRLAQKGFLNIDKSGKRAIYIPSVTSKKFYELCPGDCKGFLQRSHQRFHRCIYSRK